MPGAQEQYDAAMLAFSQGALDRSVDMLGALLAEHPGYFDAQMALGMAYYQKGDYAAAIREGHQTEQLQPSEPLVHTNLSLFYVKAGDRQKAEHHGAQARVASWRGALPGSRRGAEAAPGPAAAPPPKPPPPSIKFPEQPWKKARKQVPAFP